MPSSTKRKRSSLATAAAPTNSLPPVLHDTPIHPPSSATAIEPPIPEQKRSRRDKIDTNPNHNADIVDGKTALRASPDADEKGELLDVKAINGDAPAIPPIKSDGMKRALKVNEVETVLSDASEISPVHMPAKTQKKSPTKSSLAEKKGSDEVKAFKAAKKAVDAKLKKEEDEDKWDNRADPDGDEAAPAEDVDVMKKEARRHPPVHSDYLPLPWKGRLGYACLNTYLRFSNPPIFTSRTCHIASILEHRHPLKDPIQPEHPTKNRPDKTQPASIERGKRYVEELCLANVRDIPKMLRWNDKYGIKFMRLSSEMCPFASHAEYGYKLAPFASEALAEAGRVAAELDHRVSVHPGQFTQLGSPRPEVISSAIRDLQYHDELLSLLHLPEQTDRDAVMILHMGGTFGDKSATLDRFRSNYTKLSPGIKKRLVLENDDVSWSVHDLLPICEELNIPLCLDFHHHNIIFDSSQLREGTHDIRSLFPRIKATWGRKGIRQKMHYSEPTPEAITRRQRRKHSPRPKTLPPCPSDIDLIIEAKDKEQAVFELMRTFKLPGWERANDIVPFEREDDNRLLPKKVRKKTKKQVAAEIEEFGKEVSEDDEVVKEVVPEEEIGMGGRENRVYWPVGMEEWLRPKKREVKKRGEDEQEMFRNPTPANFAARKAATARNEAPLREEAREKLRDANSVAEVQALLEEIKAARLVAGGDADGEDGDVKPASKTAKMPPRKSNTAKKTTPSKKPPKKLPIPSLSKMDDDEEDMSMPDLSASDVDEPGKATRVPMKPEVPVRQSDRMRRKRMSYAELDREGEEE